MSRKSDVISNISIYPEYYFHVAKGFATKDISTSKINNKKEKKNILIFPIKFSIFILLIWILKDSNNCDYFRSWNYKNEIKNILYLGAKRLLTENDDIIKQANEGLKYREQKEMIETDLESIKEKDEIEEKIDIEQSEIEEKLENKKIKFNGKISSKCQNNLKVNSLICAFILSCCSFLLSLKVAIAYDLITPQLTLLFVNLSITIFSILLILEQTQTKPNDKL
ncbi:fam-h protein [Plasmodium relictum]|uniref:Fam-h protein n=1 Tax=Plasmodium relictum TaxID=85471 RepID=A0A1J1GNY2_PLARL|nr:fam-h protein [Plasmodium relictum]CRG84827.1 fam-h protein [Plasmodium relictum]